MASPTLPDGHADLLERPLFDITVLGTGPCALVARSPRPEAFFFWLQDRDSRAHAASTQNRLQQRCLVVDSDRGSRS